MPSWGAQKTRAYEPLARDVAKRRVEEQPRKENGKRQVESSAQEVGKGKGVEPFSGPLEPWVDADLVLSSNQKASKRVSRPEIIEGLFYEEIGYSGMTLSALEDQMKVVYSDVPLSAVILLCLSVSPCSKRDEQMVNIAELNRTIGEKARLEREIKKNAELSSAVEKQCDVKRGLKPRAVHQKELGEAKQHIEAFSYELRSSYDDAVKYLIESAEYQDRLAGQRVEGYFDLIDKVGENYPSLN